MDISPTAIALMILAGVVIYLGITGRLIPLWQAVSGQTTTKG